MHKFMVSRMCLRSLSLIAYFLDQILAGMEQYSLLKFSWNLIAS